MSPSERASANNRNPTMNHGTSSWNGGQRRAPRPRRDGAPPAVSSESPSTTGPSISTRTSFTTVPTWLLSSPIGSVAASTCGTA